MQTPAQGAAPRPPFVLTCERYWLSQVKGSPSPAPPPGGSDALRSSTQSSCTTPWTASLVLAAAACSCPTAALMLARRALGSTSPGSPGVLEVPVGGAGVPTGAGIGVAGVATGAGPVVVGVPTAAGLVSGNGTARLMRGLRVAVGLFVAVEVLGTDAVGLRAGGAVGPAAGFLLAVEIVRTAPGLVVEGAELVEVDCLLLPPPTIARPMRPTANAVAVSATTSHVDSFPIVDPSVRHRSLHGWQEGIHPPAISRASARAICQPSERPMLHRKRLPDDNATFVCDIALG